LDTSKEQALRQTTPGTTELPGNVTLSQVAQRAGVSGMTVSRVLRGSANVSEETRARVQAAVSELGYVPNRLAGALATAHSQLMVVILPSLANIVFPEVLRGVTERLEAAGYQAVVGVSDYDLAKEERLIEAMLSWRPSGWIVAGLEHTPRARQMLADARAPVVEIMDIDGEPIDMAVGLSNAAAGRCIGEHLAASGRCRIGYVGGNLARDLRAAKRREGFVQALAQRGLSLQGELTADEPSSLLLGRSGLKKLLEAHPDLDAVYFSNDDMAVGGLMHCLQAGIDVPGRLALAGFNGLEIGEATPLRLTTVRSPRRRIGQTAAEHVLARLDRQPCPRRLDVGYEFIAGQTA
jgi:LacI family gluconate utilization system Gnt-I transcriptional repressor